MVATALLRGDPSKYLQAFAASLSDWAAAAPAAVTAPPFAFASAPAPAPASESLPPAASRWWVSLLVDPAAPLELHDRLSIALLDALVRLCPLPHGNANANSNGNSNGNGNANGNATEILQAVISEPAFSRSGPTLALPRRRSSPGAGAGDSAWTLSASTRVRRASFAIRFLKRSCAIRNGREVLLRAAETSGIFEWLVRFLSTGWMGVDEKTHNDDNDNDNDDDDAARRGV